MSFHEMSSYYLLEHDSLLAPCTTISEEPYHHGLHCSFCQAEEQERIREIPFLEGFIVANPCG